MIKPRRLFTAHNCALLWRGASAMVFLLATPWLLLDMVKVQFMLLVRSER